LETGQLNVTTYSTYFSARLTPNCYIPASGYSVNIPLMEDSKPWSYQRTFSEIDVAIVIDGTTFLSAVAISLVTIY